MEHKSQITVLVFWVLAFNSALWAEQQVTFHCEMVPVGRQTNQDVRLNANMTSRVKSPGQETLQARQIDYTLQRRTVTVLAAEPTFVTKARVLFDQALQKQGRIEKDQPQWISQPVDGKSYDVSRAQEELVITAPDGSIPSEVERKIVEHSMRSVGRPNPIAIFLHGRTVRIGETIVMSAELASQLMGSTDGIEGTQEMPIQLVDITDIDGVPCGTFAAQYRRVTHDGARTSSTLSGQIAVQTDTCQVVSVQFKGPITFRQIRSFGGKQKIFESVGTISIAMKSNPAKR